MTAVAPTITRTVGDRRRLLYATLQDDGVAADLTGCTVALRAVDYTSGVLKIDDAPCSIIDAVNGRVSYGFETADVDTAGDYAFWFIVTDGGLLQHYPGDGKSKILTLAPSYPES